MPEKNIPKGKGVLVQSDFDETLTIPHYYGALFGKAASPAVKDLVKNKDLIGATTEVFSQNEGKGEYKSKELLDYLVASDDVKNGNVSTVVSTRNQPEVVDTFFKLYAEEVGIENPIMPGVVGGHALMIFNGQENPKEGKGKLVFDDKLFERNTAAGGVIPEKDLLERGAARVGKVLHVLKGLSNHKAEKGSYPISTILLDDSQFNVDVLKPMMECVISGKPKEISIKAQGATKAHNMSQQEVKNAIKLIRGFAKKNGIGLRDLKKIKFEASKVPDGTEMAAADKQWDVAIKDQIGTLVNEDLKARTKVNKKGVKNDIKEGSKSQKATTETEAHEFKRVDLSLYDRIVNFINKVSSKLFGIEPTIKRKKPDISLSFGDIIMSPGEKSEVVIAHNGIALDGTYENVPGIKAAATSIQSGSSYEEGVVIISRDILNDDLYANTSAINEAESIGDGGESNEKINSEPVYATVKKGVTTSENELIYANASAIREAESIGGGTQSRFGSESGEKIDSDPIYSTVNKVGNKKDVETRGHVSGGFVDKLEGRELSTSGPPKPARVSDGDSRRFTGSTPPVAPKPQQDSSEVDQTSNSKKPPVSPRPQGSGMGR